METHLNLKRFVYLWITSVHHRLCSNLAASLAPEQQSERGDQSEQSGLFREGEGGVLKRQYAKRSVTDGRWNEELQKPTKGRNDVLFLIL